LELDEPLQAHLPNVAGLDGGVTVRHLLTHTAGLHLPSAFEMELVPPRKRPWLVERMDRPAGWRVGEDAAFSEYTSWVILGWLLEALRGEPLREHLRATVLDPLGLESTWIGMTEADYKAVTPRLGVSYDLMDRKPMPMLLEVSPRWCIETNPSHGGYSTAADLARFYSRILDWLADGHKRNADWRHLIQTCVATARPPVHDQTLNRVCPWGLGFMTSLGEHLFGEVCSTASFGHSGYLGTSFAFADPQHSLVIAVIYNGIVLPDVTTSRRIGLVRAIYSDLGLGEGAEPQRASTSA
jgi:CubicO group peptidase (beta-lactamase class C family)